MGGLRVLVGATSVSQVGRSTGRGGGFGKVMTGSGSIQLKLCGSQTSCHILRIPKTGGAVIISFNSDSVALGVLARPCVWGTRIVAETRGCHSCFAFRCLGYVLVSA